MINNIQTRVEDDSATVDNMVKEVVTRYSKDLDAYICFVRECLNDGQNPPTDSELEDMLANISTYIYFASTAVESAGIRSDIAAQIYKEKYNTVRHSLTEGTVADKNAQAEILAREEELISTVYKRSYNVLKAKVNAAQELLSSLKKILSHRMQEKELTRING